MDSLMKLLLVQLLLWVSTFIHSTQGECIGCASGIAFSDSCYTIEQEAVTFSAAEAVCTSRNQHLIYIESNNEQVYIQQIVSQRFPDTDIWIGLTKDSSDVIVWLDQSRLVYNKWMTMAMSSFNDGTACFRMRQTRDYRWHDKECDTVFGYICEEVIGPNGCDVGMVSYGESCYAIDNEPVNHNNADITCQNMGAHLVFIETLDEQEFLKSQILLVDNQADFWMGLIMTSAGGVLWKDGRALIFNYFQYDSFNEGASCFRMRSDLDYYWHDRPCSFLFSYICEQESVCSSSEDGDTQSSPAPTTIGDDESSTESEETTKSPTTDHQPRSTQTTKTQGGELRSSYVKAMAANSSLPDSAIFANFRANSIIRCAGVCNELADCTHFTHVITSSSCLLGNAANLQPAELVHLDGARSFAVSGS